MQKELRYQDEAERFIKTQWEAYNGQALTVYKEEFSHTFDAALQAGVSPLIRDASVCQALAGYGIVGLQQKILELNQERITAFCAKHKLSVSPASVAALMFDDFQEKYSQVTREDELFNLLFAQSHEVAEKALRRRITLTGAEEPLDYNVVFYEKPGTWSGKNEVFLVRERRIPVVSDTKKSERPDFMVYMNGFPLILVEYKTEDSGIAEGLKDFELKASYGCAPFKAAINDGRNVIFFSNIESLILRDGRNNAFEWVHFGDKKYVGTREYTNAEYFFEELVCQPQNLYTYCMDCCSVNKNGASSYLVNARIQQYYALKSIKDVLLRVSKQNLALPFNYEFAHAQRSGKTITMKLICYMLARQFAELYQTIFIYTPDLQIKKVLATEFARAGYTRASISVIESRAEYLAAVSELAKATETSASFKIYIVNMQKITADDMLANLRVESTGVLNIIDEAHHGQARQLAELRDQVFPKASNFLFTATGKSEMYAYYFPDNNAAGFRNKFTISDAKRCGITVPVHFLHAEKTFKLSDKLEIFSRELERRLASKHTRTASVYDVDTSDMVSAIANGKVAEELKRNLNTESMPAKLDYICSFMDEIKPTLDFVPKAIVYVDSVAAAKHYIALVQKRSKKNCFSGYRFGVDFAELTPENCANFNPGIADPKSIEACFQKVRTEGSKDASIIDILFAVDKYQKGFDLPELMVTFLDTSIQEPARMNQIYTRTATKRPGKHLGYCIDLTLDSHNDETFQTSMQMYDSNDAKDCFIDADLLSSVNEALVKAFTAIKTTLNLAQGSFTAYGILQEVLNEPDLSKREMKQEVFFTTSQRIVASLGKIGSPLYYKPFATELKALFEAFYEFKLIYADKLNPEHGKILINLDRSFKDGAYLTTAEIKSVIRDVLKFVEERNLASLLNFGYITNGHNEILADQDGQLAVQRKKARDEERVNDLKRQFGQIGDALKHNHKPLYEHIRNLLYRISENRALAHDEQVQEDLNEIAKQLADFRAALHATIQKDFEGNALLYWLTTECQTKFAEEQVEAPSFCAYIAKALEPQLRIILPQLEDSDKSIYLKTITAIELVLAKSVGRFTSYFTSFPASDEKASLQSRLKELAVQAKETGVQSFANDEDAFKAYLKKALTNYYQHAEV